MAGIGEVVVESGEKMGDEAETVEAWRRDGLHYVFFSFLSRYFEASLACGFFISHQNLHTMQVYNMSN